MVMVRAMNEQIWILAEQTAYKRACYNLHSPSTTSSRDVVRYPLRHLGARYSVPAQPLCEILDNFLRLVPNDLGNPPLHTVLFDSSSSSSQLESPHFHMDAIEFAPEILLLWPSLADFILILLYDSRLISSTPAHLRNLHPCDGKSCTPEEILEISIYTSGTMSAITHSLS